MKYRYSNEGFRGAIFTKIATLRKNPAVMIKEEK